MQNYDKLIGLVEEASSSITMLCPEDSSEIKGLKNTLEQIKGGIGKIKGVPSELVKDAEIASSDAINELGKILTKEVKDSEKSIEEISKAIVEIQNLIRQFEKAGDTEAESQSEKPQVNDAGSEVKTEDKGESETVGAEVDSSLEETVVSEDDIPLVLDFIAESKEHIEASEAGLLELENKPDDDETINLIFRAFHTIKGMAGFLNLYAIGSLAHSAENLLDLARKGELVLSGINIDLVFESIDTIKNMINSLQESIKDGKPVPCHGQLGQLLGKLKSAADGENLAASLNTEEGQQKDNKLEDILEVKDESTPSIKTANYSGPDRRSSSNSFDRRSSGDGDRRSSSTVEEKIKVSTSRLDKLVNMAGELVIAQLMVAEEVDRNLPSEHGLKRKVSHQSKITRELQELSMSMRMVPIHGVFQKMARLVRDLSHKAEKQITLVTSGEETELDRSIVDKIADPLVHMIRNSIDHGIESSEERLRAGKDSVGRIRLRAFHQAGNIVIEIMDDGKGLNTERILQKAIDNGVVSSGQDLSDDEICKLIFHAGLSTAQKVTSISGRGVGMDVVKKNIEALRGKVDISTTAGKGTVFTISLPLTLAIIDGQVVRIGEERYIIPITSIESSLRPTAKQISTVQNRGELVLIHGELLPIVRLYKLFKVPPDSEKVCESSLVIIEEGPNRCCLLVDELLGQQQIVIKSLGGGIGRVKGVSGGSIMGDGRVSLILDIPGLIELSKI